VYTSSRHGPSAKARQAGVSRRSIDHAAARPRASARHPNIQACNMQHHSPQFSPRQRLPPCRACPHLGFGVMPVKPGVSTHVRFISVRLVLGHMHICICPTWLRVGVRPSWQRWPPQCLREGRAWSFLSPFAPALLRSVSCACFIDLMHASNRPKARIRACCLNVCQLCVPCAQCACACFYLIQPRSSNKHASILVLLLPFKTF
jgi:hypothetical protein